MGPCDNTMIYDVAHTDGVVYLCASALATDRGLQRHQRRAVSNGKTWIGETQADVMSISWGKSVTQPRFYFVGCFNNKSKTIHRFTFNSFHDFGAPDLFKFVLSPAYNFKVSLLGESAQRNACIPESANINTCHKSDSNPRSMCFCGKVFVVFYLGMCGHLG
jgi:hypothetical protein